MFTLKQKLDDNVEDVRKQYLTLTRERNIYLEKWKLIEAIGQENNWEDRNGILSTIFNIINDIKA